MVGLTDPERRLEQYPHHLSGGMRQRVMIAMGLACNPKLIIADEPTTALDVTIQAQILELMHDLARRLNIAMIIITHNLGIVARYADSVNVMYAARLVEQGTADDIFGRSSHPYTIGLIDSDPAARPAAAGEAGHDRGGAARFDGAARRMPVCRRAVPTAIEKCGEDPPLAVIEPGHQAACWRRGRVAGQDHAGRAPVRGVVPPPPAAETPIRVSVRDLKRHFTVSAGRGWFGGSATVRAVDERQLRHSRGRNARPRRRERLRQDDHRPRDPHLDEPTAGSILIDGQDIARRACARGATPHAGDLPGSITPRSIPA